MPCVRQLSESRCLCTWARRSRDITGASILHAEQLWRDFRVDGQPGCAAGSFGSCELGRMHGHFDQRHQREVSLNACRRPCATCPAKMGPSATARAGVVAEESWVLAARTTCGPGVTLLPVRLRPASEHPPAVCVCAVGAHCSSPADGDVPYAGTQHMQRLGGWACRHGAELRVT